MNWTGRSAARGNGGTGMTTERPKVTLAMPVRNGADYIESAIESLLAQTFEDFELIVTDNASTDRTAEIVRAFAARDERVQYHLNPTDLGAAGNYNRGFELARGEYLKWCAHDDLISPNYLKRAVTALDEDPQAVLAYGTTQMIDGDGTPFDGNPPVLSAMDDPRPAARFERAIRIGGSCGAIFGLFRKSALERSLLHRKYYQSDRALLAEMALLGKFVFLEDIVFLNREHATRSMSIDDKFARARWQNGTASRRFALEQWPLSRHYWEIVWRHRAHESLGRTAPRLLRWNLGPKRLGRHGLELVWIISPGFSKSARRMWLRLNPEKPRAGTEAWDGRQ